MENLNFVVIDEPWNEYLLSDNSIIRLKSVLVEIYEEPDLNLNINRFKFKIQNIIQVKQEDTDRNKANIDKINLKDMAKIRIGIKEEINDSWNLYQIINRKIKIKSFISQIYKVENAFDKDGNSIYLTVTNNVIEDLDIIKN